MNSISAIFRILRQGPFKYVAPAIFVGGAIFGVLSYNGDAIWAQRALCIISCNAPCVSLTAPPVLAENKTLLFSYDASDISGIKEVALRVTPHDPMPGANNAPVEFPLPVPSSKRILRTDSQDLTSHPWAGQEVTLQIVATNGVGKRNLTDAINFTLPERRFFHPVARVLIEERKKLMQHPEDDILREEAATIMASIAHQPANYRGDPVVLMALRSGAVRLVLGHDREAAISVNDLLWQAAARIEDGNQAVLHSVEGGAHGRIW